MKSKEIGKSLPDNASKSILPDTANVKSVLDRREIERLLKRGVELNKDSKEIEQELANVKVRLKELAEANKLTDGVRHGNYALSIIYSTRSTLDKMLLMQNGVTAEQIDSSIKPTLVTMLKLHEI